MYIALTVILNTLSLRTGHTKVRFARKASEGVKGELMTCSTTFLTAVDKIRQSYSLLGQKKKAFGDLSLVYSHCDHHSEVSTHLYGDWHWVEPVYPIPPH